MKTKGKEKEKKDEKKRKEATRKGCLPNRTQHLRHTDPKLYHQATRSEQSKFYY